MTLFDLLFLAIIFASVRALAAVVVLALSGQWRRSAWMLVGYGTVKGFRAWRPREGGGPFPPL